MPVLVMKRAKIKARRQIDVSTPKSFKRASDGTATFVATIATEKPVRRSKPICIGGKWYD